MHRRMTYTYWYGWSIVACHVYFNTCLSRRLLRVETQAVLGSGESWPFGRLNFEIYGCCVTTYFQKYSFGFRNSLNHLMMLNPFFTAEKIASKVIKYGGVFEPPRSTPSTLPICQNVAALSCSENFCWNHSGAISEPTVVFRTLPGTLGLAVFEPQTNTPNNQTSCQGYFEDYLKWVEH